MHTLISQVCNIFFVHAVRLEFVHDEFVIFLWVFEETLSTCFAAVIIKVDEAIRSKIFLHDSILLFRTFIADVLVAFKQYVVDGIVCSCYIWFEENAILMSHIYNSLATVKPILL